MSQAEEQRLLTEASKIYRTWRAIVEGLETSTKSVSSGLHSYVYMHSLEGHEYIIKVIKDAFFLSVANEAMILTQLNREQQFQGLVPSIVTYQTHRYYSDKEIEDLTEKGARVGESLISFDNFIVMPYRKGMTLKDIIRNGIKFPPEVVAQIKAEFTRVLGLLHSVGLVHMDISVGNLFVLLGEGNAYQGVNIIDFGESDYIDSNELKQKDIEDLAKVFSGFDAAMQGGRRNRRRTRRLHRILPRVEGS